VVGIGNPGPEYAGTRHNVGFLVLDQVAEELGLSFEPSGPVQVARGETDAGNFRLVKPQAYVNRSGEALAQHLAGVTVSPGAILVVVDDLALEPGVLRYRSRGSAGGHNGLRSLIRVLGTESFPRLRVGIGGVPSSVWREHVLGSFTDEEVPVVAEAFARAARGVLGFLGGQDDQSLQQQLNHVSPPAGVTIRRTPDPDSAARVATDEVAARRGRQVARGDTQVAETLNKYEGMFLMNNSLVSAEAGASVARVNEFFEKHGAKPVRVDVLDERRLAYPIKKQKRGTYVLSHFEADGDTIQSMNREISILEDILRALFVRHQEEYPEFKTAFEMEPVRARREDGGERHESGGGGGAAPARAAAPEAPAAAPEAPAAAPEAPAAPEPESAPPADPDPAPEGDDENPS